MYGANDCYCRTKNTLQNWTVSKTVKNYAYLAADGLGGGLWVRGGFKVAYTPPCFRMIFTELQNNIKP